MADRMMNFHSSILQVASIIKNKEQRKEKEKIEMEKKKRDRKANYSKQETDRLVELIISKKDILESKKNTADQWNEKREAWEDIEKEFNKNPGSGSIYRDSKNLRIKYESFKRDIKRKWNNILSNKRNQNGKMPKFTSAEKKIKEIILLPMEGFCDFDSIDDFNDNKSEDDNSTNSSMSNSNIEDNCGAIKKEGIISDEETENFAYHFDQPSSKTRDDPLVGTQDRHKNDRNNDEPAAKKLRSDPLEDCDGVQSRKTNIKNMTDDERLQQKLKTEILKEELEIKKLQRKVLEQELEHKKSLNELEKEHLLIKITALRN